MIQAGNPLLDSNEVSSAYFNRRQSLMDRIQRKYRIVFCRFWKEYFRTCRRFAFLSEKP